MLSPTCNMASRYGLVIVQLFMQKCKLVCAAAMMPLVVAPPLSVTAAYHAKKCKPVGAAAMMPLVVALLCE